MEISQPPKPVEAGPVPETSHVIAKNIGLELLQSFQKGEPQNTTRLSNTTAAYLDIPDIEAQAILAKDILEGLPIELQVKHLDDLPDVLCQYVDITKAEFDFPDLRSAKVLRLVLQNNELVKKTFGLTDSGSLSLKELFEDKHRAKTFQSAIKTLAQIIDSGTKEGITIAPADLNIFVASSDIRTKGVLFELLTSVGEKLGGSQVGNQHADPDRYFSNALLLLGTTPIWGDRLQQNESYRWGGACFK